MAGTAVSVCVEIVVVVAVVVMCHTSVRLDGLDAGAVSMSLSNKALKSTIAFCMPLGNGPDRVSAQCCSMRASFSLSFSAVFISSSVNAGDMAVFLVATTVAVEKVVTVAAAAGVVAAECVAACFS
jgi:hypothetical protein